MRTVRDTKMEIDLTKPVKLEEGEDCFGKEWEPKHPDCQLCADIDTCGILYQESIKKKVKEFDKTLPLDMTAFEKVNFSKVVKLIGTYQAEDPLTYDEIIDLVGEQAQTKDKDTVKAYLRRQMSLNNIIIQGGKLYADQGKTVTDKKSSDTGTGERPF